MGKTECWGVERDGRRQDGWMDYRLKGHEFEQVLGGGEGQGSLVCWSPWILKESDVTEGLNNNNNIYN